MQKKEKKTVERLRQNTHTREKAVENHKKNQINTHTHPQNT